MIRLAAPPLLARLRRSPRFIVLMLLVFMLRIGADVACTAHDILDAPADSAAIGMTLDHNDFDREQPRQSPFDVSGTCDHCGCHQVAAILPAMPAAGGLAEVMPPAERRVRSLPDLQALELRPPIA